MRRTMLNTSLWLTLSASLVGCATEADVDGVEPPPPLAGGKADALGDAIVVGAHSEAHALAPGYTTVLANPALFADPSVAEGVSITSRAGSAVYAWRWEREEGAWAFVGKARVNQELRLDIPMADYDAGSVIAIKPIGLKDGAGTVEIGFDVDDGAVEDYPSMAIGVSSYEELAELGLFGVDDLSSYYVKWLHKRIAGDLDEAHYVFVAQQTGDYPKFAAVGLPGGWVVQSIVRTTIVFDPEEGDRCSTQYTLSPELMKRQLGDDEEPQGYCAQIATLRSLELLGLTKPADSRNADGSEFKKDALTGINPTPGMTLPEIIEAHGKAAKDAGHEMSCTLGAADASKKADLDALSDALEKLVNKDDGTRDTSMDCTMFWLGSAGGKPAGHAEHITGATKDGFTTANGLNQGASPPNNVPTGTGSAVYDLSGDSVKTDYPTDAEDKFMKNVKIDAIGFLCCELE